MKTSQDPITVIDIGSNTIRSLIVEPLTDGAHRVLDDEREMARLASGLDQRGRLSAAAIARAVEALRRMSDIARARGSRRITVVATSAIRNAANRAVFLRKVKQETGLRVRVISGEEEAQLAFESAAQSFDLADRPCAVVDVGGGSTELILSLGRHVQHLYSLPLGAVALTERFLVSDPPRGRELKELRRELRHRLIAAGIQTNPPPQVAIASGGTASAAAQMAMAIQGLSGRSAQGFEMTQADLLHLRDALAARELSERRQMPGLSPERADIIIAGVIILLEVMRHLKVNRLCVSARGIRHALINRMISGSGSTRRNGASSPRQRVDAAEAFAAALSWEQKHARQVQRLSLALFDQLQGALELDPEERDLLSAAALLHDVGYVVSYHKHHKHSYHLIAHAQLDGFSPREREVIALVARYHRASPPRRRHDAWAALPRSDRTLVERLSALLRVADALDRRHTQVVAELRASVSRRRVRLALYGRSDLSVEIHAAEEKADLFNRIFAHELQLCSVAVRRSAAPSAAGAGRKATGAS